MHANLYTLLLLLLLPFSVLAQNSGDYRSKGSGSWIDNSIWQMYDGTNWTAATNYPNNNASVTIRSNHQIATENSLVLTISKLTVNANALLTIGSGSTVIINSRLTVNAKSTTNPNSLDGKVIVSGTLQGNDLSTISARARTMIEIGSTGTYRHNWTSEEGDIPLITWNTGSTLLITGYEEVSYAPNNLNQAFHNVVWNTPDLNYDIDLDGTLQTVNGNLTFVHTGIGSVYLAYLQSYSLNIGGSFIIGENANLFFTHNSVSPYINVGQNLEIKGNSLVRFTVDAPMNVDVNGNLLFNGSATASIVTTAGSGSLFLQVGGNTQFIGGNIIKPGTGNATLDLNNVIVPANAGASLAGAEVLVNGNWTNNGGSFTGAASNFIFQGSEQQSIQSNNQPFGNVELLNNGIKTVTDNMTVNGSLTLNSNTTLNLNGNLLTLNGNWINTGGIFTPQSGGTVILNGANPQNIIAGTQAFGNLIVRNTGIKMLQDKLDVNGSLLIFADATLDVNSTHDINLAGNWENNGSFNSGTAKVFFDGSAPQTIGGASPTGFNDIVVSNSSVGVISSQNLIGNLDLRDGVTFNVAGSADFTLVSGPTTTASIGTLGANAAVTGSVVVQRYLHAEGTIFRYVATPVTTATVGDWADDEGIIINLAGSPSENFYFYHEPDTGFVDNGWTAYPQSLTDPLRVGRGYALGIFEGTSPKILQIKGPVQQGPTAVSLPVSFTDTQGSDEDDDGWNLVGNPYPSTINWESIYANRSSKIDPTMWITNSAAGDYVYQSFHAEAGELNGGTPLIASGQAFWVKAIGANPSLQVAEQDKAAINNAEFFRKKELEDVLVVSLKNGNKLDETAIIFRDNALSTYEPARDTYKLKNKTYSLSSLGADQEDLAYNFLPWYSCSSEVKLFLDNAQPGSYTFSFRNLDTFKRPATFTLVDQLTGQEVAVSANTTYTFSVTSDPKSFGKERFKLSATYQNPQLDLPVTAEATCANSDAIIYVDNAQQGINYQAIVNGEAVGALAQGNNEKLMLMIPAGVLQAGAHEIQISASRSGCVAATLLQTANIVVDQVYEISKVEGGISCEGKGGTVTLKAAGAPTNGSYRWYSNATDSAPIQGATENTFTTPPLSEDTWYFVTALNAIGCESSVRTKVLAKVGTAEIPVITHSADKLIASGSGTFQWYLNGQAIAEGTSATLLPTETGIYTVELQNTEGCITLSEAFTYEALGIEELEKLGITLWPNPSSDFVYVNLGDQTSKISSIRILSVEGKVVHSQKVENTPNNRVELDVRTLKSGLYVVEINAESSTVRLRIVRQ